MDITSLGHSSFRLRGKNATVVTDPYDSAMTGLKFPKHTAADIVTISHHHKDHDAVSEIEGSPFIVDGAGEYEVKGIGIIGIRSFHDTQKGKERGEVILYRIEIDGVSFLHLGDLGCELTSDEVSQLDGIDVLFVPVGGDVTIGNEAAVAMVNAFSPSIVIPMHYQQPGLNQQVFSKLAPVDTFLKEMGKEGVVPQPKLTITKDRLPETMQVVVLS